MASAMLRWAPHLRLRLATASAGSLPVRAAAPLALRAFAISADGRRSRLTFDAVLNADFGDAGDTKVGSSRKGGKGGKVEKGGKAAPSSAAAPEVEMGAWGRPPTKPAHVKRPGDWDCKGCVRTTLQCFMASQLPVAVRRTNECATPSPCVSSWV